MTLSSPGTIAALVPPLVIALGMRSIAPARPSLGRTLVLFAIGALSFVPAVMLATMLERRGPGRARDPYLAGLEVSFFEAALPEEVVRLGVVALALALAGRRAGPMPGVVFGAIAGSGFAAAEGMVGVLGGESLLATAVGRSLGAVGHASYGIIMGFFLGRAWTRPGWRRVIDGGLALGLPVLLHMLYDVPMLTEVPGMEAALAEDQLPPWPVLAFMAMTPAILLLEVALAVAVIRRARRPLAASATAPGAE